MLGVSNHKIFSEKKVFDIKYVSNHKIFSEQKIVFEIKWEIIPAVAFLHFTVYILHVALLVVIVTEKVPTKNTSQL